MWYFENEAAVILLRSNSIFRELNRNRLNKIEGLTFDGLISLTVLRLRRNEITQLFDGAFFGLSAIQQL